MFLNICHGGLFRKPWVADVERVSRICFMGSIVVLKATRHLCLVLPFWKPNEPCGPSSIPQETHKDVCLSDSLHPSSSLLSVHVQHKGAPARGCRHNNPGCSTSLAALILATACVAWLPLAPHVLPVHVLAFLIFYSIPLLPHDSTTVLSFICSSLFYVPINFGPNLGQIICLPLFKDCLLHWSGQYQCIYTCFLRWKWQLEVWTLDYESRIKCGPLGFILTKMSTGRWHSEYHYSSKTQDLAPVTLTSHAYTLRGTELVNDWMPWPGHLVTFQHTFISFLFTREGFFSPFLVIAFLSWEQMRCTELINLKVYHIGRLKLA